MIRFNFSFKLTTFEKSTIKTIISYKSNVKLTSTWMKWMQLR